MDSSPCSTDELQCSLKGICQTVRQFFSQSIAVFGLALSAEECNTRRTCLHKKNITVKLCGEINEEAEPFWFPFSVTDKTAFLRNYVLASYLVSYYAITTETSVFHSEAAIKLFQCV